MASDDTEWSAETVTDAKLNATALFSFTNLAAFPSSNFAVLSKGIAEDTEIIYQNTGTDDTPVWTILMSGVPAGSVTMFGGPTANVPTGWLRCDGASLLRAGTYAKLFAAISTEWGSADGTHFNVPDFETSNLFPRAAHQDSEIAATGGAGTVTLSIAQMPVHSHFIPQSAGGSGSTVWTNDPDKTKSNSNSTESAGSGNSHENKPPYVSIYFIIKI